MIIGALPALTITGHLDTAKERQFQDFFQDAIDPSHGLAVSDITLLELATLASKGRIRLDVSLESFLEEVEARFMLLPISGRACARAVGLPAAYPRDPADRIIGATALVEGLALVTADRGIRRAKALDTIW